MTFAPEQVAWYQAVDRLTTSRKADLGVRYFDIKLSTRDEMARWQPFQLDLLNCQDTFVSINKSRQIGASFILSGDALFDGFDRGNHTTIAVSYNLEEAKEKIIYAKQWWESRHPEPSSVPARNEFDEYGNWRGKSPYRLDHWPELIVDNSLELRWSNGFRILSHPCRPPRGKKASVLLDEFAHYQHDKAIYTAAFPMITRGYGNSCRIIVASTPLGANGTFWEIHTNQQNKHSEFQRFDYGWWEIENLCEPEYRLDALTQYEQNIPVEKVVKKYGTKRLHQLYGNIDIESFLQEYHLSFLDSAHAYLPWNLIKSAYPQYWQSLEESSEFDEVDFESMTEAEYERRYLCVRATGYMDAQGTPHIDDILKKIDRLAEECKAGNIGSCLVWTFDCGRDRDASEINVWEVREGKALQRALFTMRQMKFEAQKLVIRTLLQRVPIIRGMIDKGGVGRDIAEWASQKFGSERAAGVWYDAAKKELWIKTLKLMLEKRLITLIPDQEQEQQLHDVERHITASKNFVFRLRSRTTTTGTGQKVEHHGDKVWTCAQGAYLCSQLIDSGRSNGRTSEPNEDMVTARGEIKKVARKFRYGETMVGSRAAATRVATKMRR